VGGAGRRRGGALFGPDFFRLFDRWNCWTSKGFPVRNSLVYAQSIQAVSRGAPDFGIFVRQAGQKDLSGLTRESVATEGEQAQQSYPLRP